MFSGYFKYRILFLFVSLFVFVFLDIIHKYVRDKYSKRFPELESLATTPLEYILAVKVLKFKDTLKMFTCIYYMFSYV